MTLKVSIPSSRFKALDWVTSVIFNDFLGLKVEVGKHSGDEVIISHQQRRLVLQSKFPDLDSDWASQMPRTPLDRFETSVLRKAGISNVAPLPILFGKPKVTSSDDEISTEIDIFGGVFFTLSRFEEVVKPDRDKFDRFSALASIASAEGFLFRPIVDEYVDLLWTMLIKLWPRLRRAETTGKTVVSCDVDQPFDRAGSNPMALLRNIGGDLFRRRSAATAMRRSINFLAHRHGNLRFDPFYTFDWYMRVCENAGQRAAFYFIADHSAGAIDGDYDIFDPRIIQLMREIQGRGHEIGMHGSFNTYRNGAQIKRELERLTTAANTAGSNIAVLGNRQHYLRWDVCVTPDLLDEAGFVYDTSGSFADRPGFRYGTSRSFPMWSWQKLSPLKLRQRPLVLMECSVVSKAYMGLGYTKEALDTMRHLKDISLCQSGDFTLLWHNSHLLTKQDRIFFKKLVGA